MQGVRHPYLTVAMVDLCPYDIKTGRYIGHEYDENNPNFQMPHPLTDRYVEKHD